jgi:hypothetical protein
VTPAGWTPRVAEVSRRLRSRADAILAAVWFMPEAATGYLELGLSPAASSMGGRAACLGRVPGAVAAALFAPVRAEHVAPPVDEAWLRTEPAPLLDARRRAAVAFLEAGAPVEPASAARPGELLRRAVEAAPTAGHPVFAGLRATPWPDDPVGILWRASDMVRERRGDSHRNAWVAAGLAPVEIQLLTERWRASTNPGSTTAAAMGYPAGDIAVALDGFRTRGLVDADGGLTDAGRALREEVEQVTDVQQTELVAALGDDVDELLDAMVPWTRAVVDAAIRQMDPTKGDRDG